MRRTGIPTVPDDRDLRHEDVAEAIHAETSLSANPAQLLNALPHPILAVGVDGFILEANLAAEIFFGSSRSILLQQTLLNLLPFGSVLLSLVEQVMRTGAAINEYRVDLGVPRLGTDKMVDLFVTPLSDGGDGVVIMLQERTMAEKMDRQLTHRGAARSVTAMRSRIPCRGFAAPHNCWSRRLATPTAL